MSIRQGNIVFVTKSDIYRAAQSLNNGNIARDANRLWPVGAKEMRLESLLAKLEVEGRFSESRQLQYCFQNKGKK